MDLSSYISNTKFSTCILNASGPICSMEEELIAIEDSNAGGVVTKTATFEKREGNEKP